MTDNLTDQPCVICGTPVTTLGDNPLCSMNCKNEYEIRAIRNAPDDECPLCDEEYSTKGGFTYHAIQEHDIDPRVKRCEQCYEEFVPSNRVNKYCSTECFGESFHHGYVSLHCENCGDEFVMTQSRYDAQIRKYDTKPKYCSHKCSNGGEHHPSWKEDTSRSIRETPEYRRWRQEVHDSRDNCAECGAEENLQAHHIVPVDVDASKATDVDNGVRLCGRCHSKKHPNLSEQLFL